MQGRKRKHEEEEEEEEELSEEEEAQHRRTAGGFGRISPQQLLVRKAELAAQQQSCEAEAARCTSARDRFLGKTDFCRGAPAPPPPAPAPA